MLPVQVHVIINSEAMSLIYVCITCRHGLTYSLYGMSDHAYTVQDTTHRRI
jgi:hypothetical protein